MLSGGREIKIFENFVFFSSSRKIRRVQIRYVKIGSESHISLRTIYHQPDKNSCCEVVSFLSNTQKIEADFVIHKFE